MIGLCWLVLILVVSWVLFCMAFWSLSSLIGFLIQKISQGVSFFLFRQNVYIWWDLSLRIYNFSPLFFTTSASTFLVDGHFCIYILYIHISHFYFLDLLRTFLFVWREVLMGDSMLLWDENVVILRLREMCCWLFVLFGIVFGSKSRLDYYLLPSIPFYPLLIYLSNVYVVLPITLLILVFLFVSYLVFPIISWSLLKFDGINLTLIN
jgi:hypothetical protein